MGQAYLLVIIIVIIAAFFVGNIMIISAMSGNGTADWGEYWILIFIAVVIDFILIFLAMAKIMPSANSSFQLMRSGLKNRRIAKKESANLKKLLKKEKPDVNRLQELRDKRISESDTKRTLHFCQLIENIAGEEQLQDCLSEVRKKQSVLDEISDIENKVFKVAESYKNAGDFYECKHYLDILKAEKITPEITSLENEYMEQVLRRERERRAIRLWVIVFLGVFIFFAAVFARFYIADIPYRELRSMIKDQSLTAEMCNLENRESEESYYKYFKSEKGYKLLASELTRLHQDGNISEAMWLLCIQPDCIDGIHLGASSSFIRWIVEYARANGVRSTNQKDADDSSYIVTYDVDGYQILIYSYDDKDSKTNVIYSFYIINGKNSSTINLRNPFVEEAMPIIE